MIYFYCFALPRPAKICFQPFVPATIEELKEIKSSHFHSVGNVLGVISSNAKIANMGQSGYEELASPAGSKICQMSAVTIETIQALKHAGTQQLNCNKFPSPVTFDAF